ncbi:MAG: hypothetical protein AAB534_01670 [Patescibacteria group bacterium]
MYRFLKTRALKLDQRKLFLLSSIFVLFLITVYLFSVNATVFNIAERTRVEKDINILEHKIGELEFELIAERSNIDIELAYSFGFEEATDIKFISKKSVAIRTGI